MNPKKNAKIAAPSLVGTDACKLQFNATLRPKKFNVRTMNRIPNLSATLQKLLNCSVAVYDLSRLFLAFSRKFNVLAIFDILTVYFLHERPYLIYKHISFNR